MEPLCAALLVALAAAPSPEAPSGAPFSGVGIAETLREDERLGRALDAARLTSAHVPTFVRLEVAREDVEPTPGHVDLSGLEARVRAYGSRGIPVILALSGMPSRPEDAEPWRDLVRSVAQHRWARAYEVVVPGPERPEPAAFAYLLKLTAVQIRAEDKSAWIIEGGLRPSDAAWTQALMGEGLAAYLDGLAFPAGGLTGDHDLGPFLALLEQQDPAAQVFVTGAPAKGESGRAAQAVLERVLADLGTKRLTIHDVDPQALPGALKAAALLRDVLTSEVVALDERAAALKISVAADDVTATLPHRLLYNVTTFATYFLYGGPGQAGPLNLELLESTGKAPVLRDALKGTTAAVKGFTWSPDTKVARATLPASAGPLLLDFNFGGGAGYTARAEVTGSALPTVDEIIARHQEAQSAQDALVKSYTADALMEQHFRPTPTDPGYDVVTENRFFYDASGAEWEELSFTLNGSKWGPKRPPFPLLQPEKVLSLPLDLRLNKDYTYRLAGQDRIGERDCWAVRFDPVDEARPLYRGTVWIDKETYLKTQVQAVQTHMSPPVMSNEEIQTFSPQGSLAGRPLYLFSQLTSRQLMLIAGRNLLVERKVVFSSFQVNAPDFESRRAASRQTDHVMYRDTAKGLRYFVKRKDGEREVEERLTTKAKALAIGTIVDPSFDTPLPLLGLNYLDFEFLGKDSQLAVLFGGVLALVNVQRPKLLGERTDGSIDLFAIAVEGNDKVFDGVGERQEERLKSRPLSFGLNLGHQLTDFQKVTASYQFRYDHYARADETGPAFVLPTSTATHGFGLAYEWRRSGYSFGAAGYAFRRGSWDTWGLPLSDAPSTDKSYQKYSLSLTKDFFFRAVHKVHLNAAYFGGRKLDRFSTYQFGLFDENRMHGVPSSGVRFSELAMLRAQYSFNLFDQYRLDLFVDQALGRAPERPEDWQNVTGTGISVNLRGPWNTMIRGDVGKSFLPGLYGGSGSFTAQVMILKPL